MTSVAQEPELSHCDYGVLDEQAALSKDTLEKVDRELGNVNKRVEKRPGPETIGRGIEVLGMKLQDSDRKIAEAPTKLPSFDDTVSLKDAVARLVELCTGKEGFHETKVGIDSLKSSVNSYLRDNEAKETARETQVLLETQVRDLQAHVKRLQNEIDVGQLYKQDMDHANFRLGVMTQKHSQATKDNERAQQDLEAAISTCKQQNTKLTADLIKERTATQAVQVERARLETDVKHLEEHKSGSESTKQLLARELNRLTKDNESLAKRCSSLEATVESLRTRNDGSVETIKKRHKELVQALKAEAARSSEISDVRNELNHLKEAKDRDSAVMDQVTEELNEAKKTKMMDDRELSSLREECSKLKQNKVIDVATTGRTAEELTDAMIAKAAIERQLSSLQTEVTELRKFKADAESRMTNATNTTTAENERASVADNQAEQDFSRIRALEAETGDLRQDKQRLATELSTANERNSQLRIDIKCSLAETKAAHTRIESLKGEATHLRLDKANLEQQVADAESRNAQADAKIEILKEDAAHLRREKSSLEQRAASVEIRNALMCNFQCPRDIDTKLDAMLESCERVRLQVDALSRKQLATDLDNDSGANTKPPDSRKRRLPQSDGADEDQIIYENEEADETEEVDEDERVEYSEEVNETEEVDEDDFLLDYSEHLHNWTEFCNEKIKCYPKDIEANRRLLDLKVYNDGKHMAMSLIYEKILPIAKRSHLWERMRDFIDITEPNEIYCAFEMVDQENCYKPERLNTRKSKCDYHNAKDQLCFRVTCILKDGEKQFIIGEKKHNFG
ncbi:hypothetical protein CkaCkLH20_12358 [Colletotrichum karsti]|uniref:Uncharacterized protein n=1 Tax=Colletotrichum karsti TaxID=1095194 RepID=A0A9P6HTV1_9PEZI|nr:uncharacterized protein CkaCkLH20_12358 [Colletotrichum karsti]KAF9870124.1 hypothetical protein CkaCkLH20_12358 [Colletotrichum karsti]